MNMTTTISLIFVVSPASLFFRHNHHHTPLKSFFFFFPSCSSCLIPRQTLNSTTSWMALFTPITSTSFCIILFCSHSVVSAFSFFFIIFFSYSMCSHIMCMYVKKNTKQFCYKHKRGVKEEKWWWLMWYVYRIIIKAIHVQTIQSSCFSHSSRHYSVFQALFNREVFFFRWKRKFLFLFSLYNFIIDGVALYSS